MTFMMQSMKEIYEILDAQLKESSSTQFLIVNPDLEVGHYSGTVLKLEDETYLYRGYKVWVGLSEILGCRMMTPKILDNNLVEMCYKKISKEDSFHHERRINIEEKYGEGSSFFKINKMEEPTFLFYFMQALQNVNIAKRTDILDLGISRGDELGLIKSLLDTKEYQLMNFSGIDHSKTAIEVAKALYPEPNIHLYEHDINKIDSLKLGRFDLLISISTLQSPEIHFKTFFMDLVQKYLKKDSAIILGFPNSRWSDGELIYGAKAPNYAMSEMSILFNDVMFCKKYLQQHKYRVTITGKEYLFLTATKII